MSVRGGGRPDGAVGDPDLLALLVDSVSDYAIFALDVEGHVTSWNEGAARLQGYTADEILGQHFSRFYSSEDLEAGTPERELAIAVADGHFEVEGWRIRKDGAQFWASVVITALRGVDDRLVGFGHVTKDLTERRRGDDLLRESEERFRLLVNSVLDYAIFLLDPDGAITTWNAGAERLKGYRADEILGRHFSVFYTRDERRDGVPGQLLQQAFDNGRVECEGWRVRRDGSLFWASVVITSLRSADGQHRGFAKVTKDLTDRKRGEDALRGVLARERDAAERLREVDRMRAEVVGLVAHDLRAPLSVIRSLSHLLQADWDQLTDEAKLEHLARVGQRASGMSALVEDLLDVVHIESGQIQVDHVPFEIGVVVEQAVADVVEPNAPVTITTDVDPRLRAIGDPRRTRQILANLLSNAVKFSPPSAPIRVEARRSDKEIIVTVTDSGRGIPADKHHLLFQRFSRVSPSEDLAGSGIGLFIAKSLVEEQGGAIEVESTAGEGSIFRFTVPCDQ